MAMTIASLHLIAVIAIALLTNSKLLTFLAALGILYLAVTVGGPSYAIADAVSTLLGLGIGLNMIGKPVDVRNAARAAESVKTSAPAPAPAPARPPLPARTSISRFYTAPIGPAKEFELHPKPRRRIGRWITLASVILAAAWWYYR